jgi:DNA repair exonuclease SbcCD ATPase subunit
MEDSKKNENQQQGNENNTPDIIALQAELEKLKGENEKLKNAQSNASSDAAKYKKELQARMSEQEKAAAEAQEILNNLKAENERLKKEQTLANCTAGYLALGFDNALAAKAAEAFYANDFSKVIEHFKTFLEAHDKALAADALRNTHRPGTGGGGSAVTKEQFVKMNYAERAKLFEENPDLYNQLK